MKDNIFVRAWGWVGVCFATIVLILVMKPWKEEREGPNKDGEIFSYD